MGYWAQAPMQREQMTLFAPTLDAMIGEGHPVRLFDEILAGCRWSEWEAEYDGKRGQPPIHPRIIASVILYGLLRGIRSSRVLEYAVTHNIDFLWLAQGHSLDHSTICGFRTKFRQGLKDLFRQLNQIAMTMGLILLKEVGLDGTRVKANNGRFETLTAAGLQEQLSALDTIIEEMLQQAEGADAADQELFETGRSTQQLPPNLAELKSRQEQLKQALEKVQAADEARRREGIDPKKNPAQLPTTDSDSRVLPNKEGGYAPNYTPMAATDVHRGFIVDDDVIASTSEHLVTVPTVDRIEENYGQRLENLLADGAHATGPNMEALEQRGVEFFSHLPSPKTAGDNPAIRDDPTQAVPASEWEKLPRNPQTKKLDKSAFVYDEEKDVYFCPQGEPLPYHETKSKVDAEGNRTYFRVYRCEQCEGCSLNPECRSDKSKRGRTVSRDEHEKRRQQFAEKMARPESKATYSKRLHGAETPFAILKRVLGLRQFLLRGLEKVKIEWSWACTAFNLGKLVREVGRLRAEFSNLMAEGEG